MFHAFRQSSVDQLILSRFLYIYAIFMEVIVLKFKIHTSQLKSCGQVTRQMWQISSEVFPYRVPHSVIVILSVADELNFFIVLFSLKTLGDFV